MTVTVSLEERVEERSEVQGPKVQNGLDYLNKRKEVGMPGA